MYVFADDNPDVHFNLKEIEWGFDRVIKGNFTSEIELPYTNPFGSYYFHTVSICLKNEYGRPCYLELEKIIVLDRIHNTYYFIANNGGCWHTK